MGELSWQDLSESKARSWQWTWRQTAATALVLCAVVSTAVLVFPVRDLLSTPEELAAKYPRSPDWLNRCDRACAALVSVSFLDGQRHCEALSQLFRDEGRTDLYSWRLAVDDRASALGCPGFPQSLSAIRASVKEDTDARLAIEHDVRVLREQEALDAAAQTLQRYERSLQEGDLERYVERVVQDPLERSLIYITVTDAWSQLPVDQRMRISQTLWQKWAILHTPADPWQSSAMFVNAEGTLLGEAPSGSEAVWLAE